MADYNETLRALRRDAAELERIAGGTGAYWTGAAAENFRRQFTAQTCQLADLLDTLGAAAGASQSFFLPCRSSSFKKSVCGPFGRPTHRGKTGTWYYFLEF